MVVVFEIVIDILFLVCITTAAPVVAALVGCSVDAVVFVIYVVCCDTGVD